MSPLLEQSQGSRRIVGWLVENLLAETKRAICPSRPASCLRKLSRLTARRLVSMVCMSNWCRVLAAFARKAIIKTIAVSAGCEAALRLPPASCAI